MAAPRHRGHCAIDVCLTTRATNEVPHTGHAGETSGSSTLVPTGLRVRTASIWSGKELNTLEELIHTVSQVWQPFKGTPRNDSGSSGARQLGQRNMVLGWLAVLHVWLRLRLRVDAALTGLG